MYVFCIYYAYKETIENGYFGCWMDNVRNRVLRYQVGREVRNIQDCAVWCMEYRLFGIEVKTRNIIKT